MKLINRSFLTQISGGRFGAITDTGDILATGYDGVIVNNFGFHPNGYLFDAYTKYVFFDFT